MKIYKSIICFLVFGFHAKKSLAVDESPLLKPVQNEEETRFFLVGVIAEGQSSGAKKGIAVIKDSKTGRSITTKVGEKLFRDSEITLSTVERNKITLSNGSKSWIVTYDQTASRADTSSSQLEENEQFASIESFFSNQEEDSDEDDGIRIRYNNDPGLFEKWYSSLKSKDNQVQEIKVAPNGELYQSSPTSEGTESVKPLRAQFE